MRKQNCYHSSRDYMLRLRRNYQKCNKAGCSIQRGILKNLFNSIATQITVLVKSVPHHRPSREQSPSKGKDICKRKEQSRGRQSVTSRRDRDQYVRHKREASYHMPIRKSYGVQGGGPNQSGIDEQRLKEIFEEIITGEEETESLWYFIAQRYYGTDRVSNNKVIKLMSFFSQNR